jgi:microcystin-dependent protein
MDNIIYTQDTETGQIVPLQISTDLLLNNNATTPIGSIILYGGSSAPSGWLICNGSAISRTTYADLYNIIGTTYGTGDTTTTFNIPDIRTRVPVGLNSSGTFNALNNKGGTETEALTVGQIPSHTHYTFSNDARTVGATVGSVIDFVSSPVRSLQVGSTSGNYIMTSTGNAPTVGLTSSVGSGTAHTNLQPYIVVNYIIFTGVSTNIQLITNDSIISSVQLNNLIDVNISTPVVGQSIAYNGSNFINYNKDYLALGLNGTTATNLFSANANYQRMLILNLIYWSTIPNPTTNSNSYLISKGSGLTYSKTTGLISGLTISKVYKFDATIDLNCGNINVATTWQCKLFDLSTGSPADFPTKIYCSATQQIDASGVSMKLNTFITNCSSFTLALKVDTLDIYAALGTDLNISIVMHEL